MRLFIKIIFILSIILLASCAKYQQYFGGKSGDYANANTTSALNEPDGVSALPASDRYSIPEINATKHIVEIAPPDYQD